MSVAVHIQAVKVVPQSDPGQHDRVVLTAILPSAFPERKEPGLILNFFTDPGEGQEYIDAYLAGTDHEPRRVVVQNVYVEEKDRPVAHDEIMLISGLPAPIRRGRPKELEGVARLTLIFEAPAGRGVNYVQAHFPGATIKYLPLSGSHRHWLTLDPVKPVAVRKT